MSIRNFRTIIVVFLSIISQKMFAFEGGLSRVSIDLQIQYADVKAGPKAQTLALQTAYFYQQRNFKSVWITEQGWTPVALKVIKTLTTADQEGLDSGKYYFEPNITVGGFSTAVEALKAETRLTTAFLLYIHDVRNGRFDPKMADRQIAIKPETFDPVKIVSEGLDNTKSTDWIDQIPPQFPEYKSLKKLLAATKQLRLTGQQPRLTTQKILKYKDRSPSVITLRKLLALKVNSIKFHAQPAFEDIYDEEVEDAVKLFQLQNGIEINGSVGPQTKIALNLTPEDRIRQIIVNMERWRWMPRDLGRRHIKVNIARFELEAIAEGKTVLRSPIIVGRTYRETPLFSAPMTGIIFNPTWHVPHTIAIRDKLPKLRRDPNYFINKGYTVYHTGGGTVDPRSIDWSQVSAKNFPYHLTQGPGTMNALGKIRFTIENNFSVYLHSTPEQYLFEKPVRTFSSGCIRVLKVAELAKFVLNDFSKWPKSKIEQTMKENKTQQVKVSETLPVHIGYFTVWIDDKGLPHFSEDIYGQDKLIWQTIERQNKKIKQSL
jgi:murein L,D-transpeptidase YcbB/YkuD